ncbi:MAG TPA: FRG domain-containing protein [Terriglobia bacterium]
MPKSYHAESVRDFITRIEEIKSAWESEEHGKPELWYRGMQKSQWSLVPKVYRHRHPARRLLEEENEVREEFVRRAPSLTTHKPENAWEWYFLMQHYGAPTRLLDWTEAPLMGLYFAVKDSKGLHDAAVWAIDPWGLNRVVLKRYEVMPPGAAGLSEADERRYRAWLPNRFDARQRLKKERPAAIYPNQFNRRIAAQRSCFTVHGLHTKGLEKQFPRSSRLVTQILVAGHAVEDVKNELGGCGIDEATIFPDLEGLGKSVAIWQQAEFEPPHAGLYTRLQPSSRHGVGVFAIRHIKKGTPIFSSDCDDIRWIEAKDLPKERSLRRFYEDFAIVRMGEGDRPTRYGCPPHFQRLTMAWYVNDPREGETPNVVFDPLNYDFRASRAICPGEELTVDSNTYSDHNRLGLTGKKAGRRRVRRNSRRGNEDQP